MRIIPITALIGIIFIAMACRNQTGSGERAAANQNAASADAAQAGNRAAASANANHRSEQGDASSEDFEGTAGTIEKKQSGIAPVLLGEVRTARHENFDRVVFEFAGASLPGYRLEYVDRPVRQCGSGNTVPVEGQGWLRAQFMPANAHTDEGVPTVKVRELRPGLPNLKELELICDFEAEVSWVLGLSRPNRYRVLELSNPARLVVDVKH